MLICISVWCVWFLSFDLSSSTIIYRACMALHRPLSHNRPVPERECLVSQKTQQSVGGSVLIFNETQCVSIEEFPVCNKQGISNLIGGWIRWSIGLLIDANCYVTIHFLFILLGGIRYVLLLQVPWLLPVITSFKAGLHIWKIKSFFSKQSLISVHYY